MKEATPVQKAVLEVQVGSLIRRFDRITHEQAINLIRALNNNLPPMDEEERAEHIKEEKEWRERYYG